MPKPGPVVRPVADRFWSHVDKTGDCWEWTAARTPLGYGVAVAENRRTTKAHRLAWELAFGAIPDGLYVCHHCDNPPCVRPSHLYLGSQRTNMADAVAKGRTARGERSPYRSNPDSYPRKLSRALAAEIRERWLVRQDTALLAAEYGVSQTSIRNVVTRRTYR